MGVTPWNTFLACEDRFERHVGSPGPPTPIERRYGIVQGASSSEAGTVGRRFDRTDATDTTDTVDPNEAHRVGWLIEVDPFQPAVKPVKRTGLGRLKHAGGSVQEARDGRAVLHMIDADVGEYLYRYVSAAPWRHMLSQGSHPLDDGSLSVASLGGDGMGTWIELSPRNPVLAGLTLGDIVINARSAGDMVGATSVCLRTGVDSIAVSHLADEVVVEAVIDDGGDDGQRGANVANHRWCPALAGQAIRISYDNDLVEPSFRWSGQVQPVDHVLAGFAERSIASVVSTPDRRTVFVGVRDADNAYAATLAIRRDDGGRFGA